VKVSSVVYRNALPSLAHIRGQLKAKHLVLIFDRRLLLEPFFKQWSNQFSAAIPVTAGEKLKTLPEFEKLARQVLGKMSGQGRSDLGLVVVGGGTVGDVGGFLASVLKRGVKLYSIPSTWLAAVDSAHGGKTALNVDTLKNQLGSFYPAKEVFICWRLLQAQPKALLAAANGEFLKMTLIAGDVKLARRPLKKLLPLLIRRKIQVVRKDPFEEKGLRHVLNLGHTLGHALELHGKMPHGFAVLLGLEFAVKFSLQLGLLSPVSGHSILGAIEGALKITRKHGLRRPAPLIKRDLLKALRQDKKLGPDGKVKFVFLTDLPNGARSRIRPVVRSVSPATIAGEARRQGWVR
jgi:3-dehydroquinate synthase